MSLTLRSVVAALLLIVPVSAELVWPSSFGHRGDLLFAASQVVGWLLLASVGPRRIAARNPELDAQRSGRRGRRLLLAACFLQVSFALLYGVTTAASGEPLEASFVLFLLGFLAQFAGGLTWGRALGRAGLRTAPGRHPDRGGCRVPRDRRRRRIPSTTCSCWRRTPRGRSWGGLAPLVVSSGRSRVGATASTEAGPAGSALAAGRDDGGGVGRDHHLDGGEPLVGEPGLAQRVDAADGDRRPELARGEVVEHHDAAGLDRGRRRRRRRRPTACRSRGTAARTGPCRAASTSRRRAPRPAASSAKISCGRAGQLGVELGGEDAGVAPRTPERSHAVPTPQPVPNSAMVPPRVAASVASSRPVSLRQNDT